jgi:hypothetical protein
LRTHGFADYIEVQHKRSSGYNVQIKEEAVQISVFANTAHENLCREDEHTEGCGDVEELIHGPVETHHFQIIANQSKERGGNGEDNADAVRRNLSTVSFQTQVKFGNY